MDDETVRRLLKEVQAARRQIDTLTSLVGAQAQVIATTVIPPASATLEEVFAAYEKIRRAELSWRFVRNRLEPLIRRLGRLRASALTPTVWAEHVAARKTDRTPRDRPPADHTLNLELGRAKEMLDFGVRSGMCDLNALRPARKIKTISARETFLTEEQIQQLLGGISDLPTLHAQMITRALILCTLDGMMRFSEARQLRRDRIGKDGVIELQAKQTKSRRRRSVALTPRALAALFAIPPVLGTHLIFANPETGRLYGQTTMRAWFRVACIASGIDAHAADGEKVVVHTMRHSGASAADARGASPMAIKDALGHSSLSTTEKYLHRHRDNSAREMARIMATGAEAERRGPRRSDVDDVGYAPPKVSGRKD